MVVALLMIWSTSWIRFRCHRMMIWTMVRLRLCDVSWIDRRSDVRPTRNGREIRIDIGSWGWGSVPVRFRGRGSPIKLDLDRIEMHRWRIIGVIIFIVILVLIDIMRLVFAVIRRARR